MTRGKSDDNSSFFHFEASSNITRYTYNLDLQNNLVATKNININGKDIIANIAS